MERKAVNIDLLQAAPAVRSSSRAMETFTRPGSTSFGGGPSKDNSLMSLAKSLGTIGDGIGDIASSESAQREKEGLAAGEMARLESNKKSFKEAVKDGTIPAGANPHLLAGYRQSELRDLAGRFNSEFGTSYTKSGLENSTDSEGFRKLYDKELKTFIAENDVSSYDPLDLGKAFLPTIKMGKGNFKNAHDKNVMAEHERRAFRALENELSGDMETLLDEEDTTIVVPNEAGGQRILDLRDTDTRNKHMGEKIAGSLSTAIQNSVDGKKANEAAIDQVVTKAVTNGDPTILDSLNFVDTGNGLLSNTTYAKGKLASARRTIQTIQHNEEKFEYWKGNKEKNQFLLDEKVKEVDFKKSQRSRTEEKQDDKDTLDELKSIVRIALLEDPSYRLRNPEEWKTLEESAAKLDPDFNLRKYEKVALEGRDKSIYYTEEEKKTSFTTHLNNATLRHKDFDEEQLDSDFKANLVSREDYRTIKSRLLKSRQEGHPFFSYSSYTKLESVIKTVVTKISNEAGDLKPDSVLAADAAVVDLRVGMERFIELNPDADNTKLYEQARSLIVPLLQRPEIESLLGDDFKPKNFARLPESGTGKSPQVEAAEAAQLDRDNKAALKSATEKQDREQKEIVDLEVQQKEAESKRQEEETVRLTQEKEIAIETGVNALKEMSNDKIKGAFNISEDQIKLIAKYLSDEEGMKRAKELLLSVRPYKVNGHDMSDLLWERVLEIAKTIQGDE